MFEHTDRSLVKGFLRAQGTDVVNGDGEKIILTGWGLGNWLLPEGYMWLSRSERFDRPRRMEQVIRELTGSQYSESFWTRFRENYVTREDIRMMAELGYNSVRIPFSWRVLMEDEAGTIWNEDGFALLDRCLDWCEEFKLYAFLDLHGAPGGQTGANIDDSVDEFPRLFTDPESWNKGIELWKELARRYKDRWIVGGYDLLNEPLRPGLNEGYHQYYLLQKLADFYDEAIREIRAIDPVHMLSIEGHHWASDVSVFYKRYDDNMVIHFHRYACMPGIEAFQEFLDTSKRLNQPLWLGETGENYPEWFAAMYPLAVSVGIGYNLWPWKKMECTNSPFSIAQPEGWKEFLAYSEGGPRPEEKDVQRSLDAFLENMKLENCLANPLVTDSAFRRPGCRVRATDFDELPGKGQSFSGLREEGNIYRYRSTTGMKLISLSDKLEKKRFGFDSGWDLLGLELREQEFACYTFSEINDDGYVQLELKCTEDAQLTVEQDDKEIQVVKLQSNDEKTHVRVGPFKSAQESVIKVALQQGTIELLSIELERLA
ncbi:glycoside hydrolase family 5 protein [Paenibacillus sp. GCM10012306]|uniref:glycoside hydrolase family 5 protein n=1 Tax=Paenibacillus sp. GCM10012306 TaxID=3317342 RepID=UPI003616B0C2